MIKPHHMCVLYVATAGLQGPLMGSDEQEIVLLIYVIIDHVQNKVSTKTLLLFLSSLFIWNVAHFLNFGKIFS